MGLTVRIVLTGILRRKWFNLGFCLGNVIKYVLRAGNKPTSSRLEDLEKSDVVFEARDQKRKENTAK